MSDITGALNRLRDHDPAAGLSPLSTTERAAIHDRIVGTSSSDPADIAPMMPVGSRGSRPTFLRGVLRRRSLIPVALVVTCAAAATATGLVPLPSAQQFVRQNARDSALTLFRKSVPYLGGTMAGGRNGTLVPYEETVIPSSVRMIAKPTVPGVGAIQFWVGDTKQRGYCTALRLPNGGWVGLEDSDSIGGTIPGCQPTRRQVGWGALILSGFDDTDAEVLTKSGKELELEYGQIVAPGHPIEVRDRYSGTSTRVIDGKYFLLVTPWTGTDDGSTDLIALNAAGAIIADERKPLAGTPTTKCIGRYDVRRYRVPGTKRTSLGYACHRYVRTIAK